MTCCRLRRPISDLHLIPCASGAAEGGAGVGVGGVWGGGLGGGSAWAGDAPIQSHHLAVNCYDNILRVYQRMVGPHTGMAADGTHHSMSGGNGSSAVTGGVVDTHAPSAPASMPSILDLPEILSSTPSFHLQVSRRRPPPCPCSLVHGACRCSHAPDVCARQDFRQRERSAECAVRHSLAVSVVALPRHAGNMLRGAASKRETWLRAIETCLAVIVRRDTRTKTFRSGAATSEAPSSCRTKQRTCTTRPTCPPLPTLPRRSTAHSSLLLAALTRFAPRPSALHAVDNALAQTCQARGTALCVRCVPGLFAESTVAVAHDGMMPPACHCSVPGALLELKMPYEWP